MNNELLSQIDERVDRLLELRSIVEKLGPFGTVNMLDGSLRVEANTLNQLHEVRDYLRTHLGTWNDNLKQQFVSLGRVCSIYVSEERPLIELWLIMPPEEAPLKPGCQVVTVTETTTRLVCEVPSE